MNVKVFLGFLLIANAAAANLYQDGGSVYILEAELTAENKASVKGCTVSQDRWDILKFDSDEKIEVVFNGGASTKVGYIQFGSVPELKGDLKSGQFEDPCTVEITLRDENGVDDANAGVCWANYNGQFAVQLCNNSVLAEEGCTLPGGATPSSLLSIDNSIDVFIKNGNHKITTDSATIEGATKPAAVKDVCKLEAKLVDEKRLNVV